MARAPAKAPLLLLLASLALLAPAASAARTLLQVVGQEAKACSSNDDCSPGIGGSCCGRDGVCHPNGDAQCLPVDCCPRGQPCKPGQACCGSSDVNCPATSSGTTAPSPTLRPPPRWPPARWPRSPRTAARAARSPSPARSAALCTTTSAQGPAPASSTPLAPFRQGAGARAQPRGAGLGPCPCLYLHAAAVGAEPSLLFLVMPHPCNLPASTSLPDMLSRVRHIAYRARHAAYRAGGSRPAAGPKPLPHCWAAPAPSSSAPSSAGKDAS